MKILLLSIMLLLLSGLCFLYSQESTIQRNSFMSSDLNKDFRLGDPALREAANSEGNNNISDTLKKQLFIPPDTDNGKWITNSASPGGNIRCMVSDGINIYVGGVFTTIGGISASRIARYNIATQIWSSLVDGKGINGVNGMVLAIAISGNKIFIGGMFTALGDGSGDGSQRFAFFNSSDNSWHLLSQGIWNDVSVMSNVIKGDDGYSGAQFPDFGPVLLLSNEKIIK